MLRLTIVSVIWALSFPLIKTFLAEVDGTLLACLRLGLAALVFLPFFRPGLPARRVLALVALGGLQFGLMYVAYLWSYRFLAAYQVAVLTILTPVYVSLFGDLLARRFRLRFHLAAILALLGAGVIVFQGRFEPGLTTGVALLQVANLSFALGQVLYRRLQHGWKFDGVRVMGPMYVGGLLVGLGALALSPGPVSLDLTATEWGLVIYLGIIASGIGFFLWNAGAARVDTGTLAAFNNATIPLAVLFSLVFLGEEASALRLLVGAAFIAGGILLSTTSGGSRYFPLARGE